MWGSQYWIVVPIAAAVVLSGSLSRRPRIARVSMTIAASLAALLSSLYLSGFHSALLLLVTGALWTGALLIYLTSPLFPAKRTVLFGSVTLIMLTAYFLTGIQGAYEQSSGSYSVVSSLTPSASQLLNDFSSLLTGNGSYASPPLVVLSPKLDRYTNTAYTILLEALGERSAIHGEYDKFFSDLSAGRLYNAKVDYSTAVEVYSSLVTHIGELNYYLRYFSPYSSANSYAHLVHGLDQLNQTSLTWISQMGVYFNFIKNVSNSSRLPVRILLELPPLVHVNSNSTVRVELRSEGEVNGSVLVNYLNETETFTATNGSFSFELLVRDYVPQFDLRVFFSGNSIYAPNFSEYRVSTDAVITKLSLSLGNYSEAGGNLTLTGRVTGEGRIMKVTLLNLTRTYLVGGEFSVEFPLPDQLSEQIYTLQVEVEPQGPLSPVNVTLHFTPKLHPTNLTAQSEPYWPIPAPLSITGEIKGGNFSLNGVRIFAFVGDKRYEGVVEGSRFHLSVPPKLTLLWGKQVIFVETDPKWYYYPETYELSVQVVNPIPLIALGLGIALVVKLRRKGGGSPKFRLHELPVRRRGSG